MRLTIVIVTFKDTLNYQITIYIKLRSKNEIDVLNTYVVIYCN